jgi:hypothetical protein
VRSSIAISITERVQQHRDINYNARGAASRYQLIRLCAIAISITAHAQQHRDIN